MQGNADEKSVPSSTVRPQDTWPGHKWASEVLNWVQKYLRWTDLRLP